MEQTSHTILIVNDCPEDRELYRRYLLCNPKYSYTVLEAELAQQGLEKCQQHSPDAVLLDYQIPDMDGLEFLAQLQTTPQESSLPVIMLIPSGNEAIAVQAIKAGAEDYLVKGQITLERLNLTVNRAIETARLRAQLQQLHNKLSECRRVEAEISQSEEHYRFLAQLIPQLIWTASPEGELLDVNQRFLDFTGLVMDQTPRPVKNVIIHPEDLPMVAQLWDEVREDGTYYVSKGRIRRADGVYIWHMNQAIPQRNEQGKIVKWFGTLTNIEAQKQLESERDCLLELERTAREAAERANRIKDEFLAILSHELRSPLNPILGWTKLLQTHKFDEAKTAQALASIERNAKLQTQLVDDLLDIAKILRGKLSMNVAPVNLAVVIESALDTVRTAATAKSILLHPLVLNIGQVSGDANRLQQIVWNLLANAIKFTPNGGRVEIRLEQVNSQAHIIVTDTGKGINPDFLPYIFESFRQEDTSIARKYGGLGLGLAIVRQLVEAHGGNISAESPGVDQGATFIVKLPLLDIQPEVNHTQAPSTEVPDLTGIRVLTIDDEPDTCELLTVSLTQYGAEAMTVTSADEVLLALESFQPDILVSDIGMPNVDGYTLLQQIRSLPAEKGGSIPVIGLTAYAREIDQKRALAMGFQEYITKPIEPNQLAQAVVALVRCRV